MPMSNIHGHLLEVITFFEGVILFREKKKEHRKTENL